jgi:membrane fusion protein, multidrug efflux system
MDAAVSSDREVETQRSNWTRRLLLWGLPFVVVAIAVYLYGSAGRFASTDNAYVKQGRVDVAPQVSGNVLEVYVAENQHVLAGQPILKLDASILIIAVAAAESRLAAARAEVASIKAAYREKAGEISVAKHAAEYSMRELKRQQELAASKLTSVAQMDAANRTAKLANGAVEVITLQQAQTTARLGGNPYLAIDANPNVRAAQADLDHARLDLEHALIRAPQAGIASHVPLAGSRVEIGRPAFAIVSDKNLWVEANFKETDLEWVRPGQWVQVDIDTYSHYRWRGRVESISQATGAEFSLLPPQNASGNWVKVVQRIPVRIDLDRNSGDPPLRDGMSASVDIDTGPHTRFDRWFGRGR